MSDDLNLRGPQDRTRINVHEDWELAYWAKKFGISKEQLIAAVKAVGPTVKAVEHHLSAAR
jgi:hypothetical protein